MVSSVEVKNLQFSYEDNKVLRGVDLALRPGEALCVFGPNGCGKTTLLECVLGLIKPQSGEILLEGNSLAGMKPPEIAARIAMVPQKQQHTFGFTVMEMVLMGRTAATGIFRSPDKEDEEIARDALRRVGMYSFRNRSFNRLSGGEAQLVVLARALAQQTRTIIFDEPTSHLDFRHELNVIKYMCSLVRDHGISLLMTTHFPNHALYMENQGIPTRVALMEEGVICACGNASDTLTEENMRRIFKIRTRVYHDTTDTKRYTYIMPLDFVDGGQWNEKEHADDNRSGTGADTGADSLR